MVSLFIIFHNTAQPSGDAPQWTSKRASTGLFGGQQCHMTFEWPTRLTRHEALGSSGALSLSSAKCGLSLRRGQFFNFTSQPTPHEGEGTDASANVSICARCILMRTRVVLRLWPVDEIGTGGWYVFFSLHDNPPGLCDSLPNSTLSLALSLRYPKLEVMMQHYASAR